MPTCKSCGAEIIWAKTQKGKAIPLDPKPEKRVVLEHPDGPMFDAVATVVDTYVSHFATCPDADKHRRR